MKYLVISDIHENFHNLSIALKYGIDNKIEHGLILGDLINPGIMHQLGKSQIHLSVILGNNDGDIFTLSKVAREYPSIELDNEYITKEISDKKMLMIHDTFLGELIAKSQVYDYVFCGHDHTFKKELFGKSILFNPGELSGHMYGKSTFGVWDSQTGSITLITILNDWVDVKRFKHDSNYSVTDVKLKEQEL